MSQHLTHQNELANQLAQDLGEPEEIGLYRVLVKRYSEDLIHRALEETLKIPMEKIRKSRGAVFLFLLKKYAGREQGGMSKDAAISG